MSVAAPAGRERLGASRDWRGRAPWLALAAVLVLAAIVLAHAGRATTFYFDEWNFLLERRGWGPYDLLRPHNEHLSVVPVVVFKLLAETVGLAHYWVYRAVLIVAVLVLGTLTWLYTRRRIGDWPALALSASIMVMGPAYIDLIWAFQLGFVLSLICGVGAFLAFDRADRAGDVAACVLLAAGLGSSGLGIPILAAAIVEVLLHPGRRARLWVVGIPLVLYAGWYLKYGKSAGKLDNAPAIPGWIANAADDAAGAALGYGATYGAIAVVVLVVALVWRLSLPGRWPVRLLALTAMPVALWSLTALARADMGVSPAEARYLLPGGLFLVLLGAELVGDRVPLGRAAALIAVVLGAGAVINADGFTAGSTALRTEAEKVRGSLAALELHGEGVDRGLTVVDTQSQLRAGWYFPAVEQYGSSPAEPIADLPKATAGIRANFDRTLWSLDGIGVAAAPPGRPTGCVSVPATADEELPPAGLVIRAGDAPVEVRLRRYAGAFPDAAVGSVGAGGDGAVKAPRDSAPRPWHAQLRSTAPFRVCHAAG